MQNLTGTSQEQKGPAVATIWSHPLKALHGLCLCKENNKPLCIEPRKILHPYRERERERAKHLYTECVKRASNLFT